MSNYTEDEFHHSLMGICFACSVDLRDCPDSSVCGLFLLLLQKLAEQ